jgi:hypothetical protein
VAETWAARLRRRDAGRRDEVRLMLASVGLRGTVSVDPAPPAQVRALATELLAHEAALPALVEAQQRDLDAGGARLLASAIETGLSEFDDHGLALESLARLTLLLDQPEIALGWVHAARRNRPFAASLALLEQEVQRHRRRLEDVAGSREMAA